MKPLFRWTIGTCLQQGLDVLCESFDKTTKAFGEDRFDWVVCYNTLNVEQVRFLKSNVGNRNIEFYAQCWDDCPIPDICWSPIKADGSYEWNGNRAGGTMWKVSPARLRLESHEIIMDNDIVFLKKIPQIEEFLNSDKAMLLEEPIRFYGRYAHLLSAEPPFFNSGFIGLPPYFDYGAALKENWKENGELTFLSHADEQGLLTYTLNQIPNIRIHKEQVIEILARDFNCSVTGQESALHFTQCNRIPSHIAWKKYKEIIK